MTEKYIGASTVIGTLKEMQKEFGECQRAFGKTAICVLEEAINKLQLLPAADAEPVVHGHWIKKSHEWDFSPYFYTDFTCSNCGTREQGPAPYCRYCGAKMYVEQDK